MTFFDFLDNRFRLLSLSLQETYSISKDAEAKSAGFLIRRQHAFFRWLSVPKLLFWFLLIQVRLLPPIEKIDLKEALQKKKTNAEVLPNKTV